VSLFSNDLTLYDHVMSHVTSQTYNLPQCNNALQSIHSKK